MPHITDATPLLPIVAAHNRHDSSAYVPFTCGGHAVGLIRREFATETLARFSEVFAVTNDVIALNGADHDERSALMAGALQQLSNEGAFKLRGEPYPLIAGWGQELLATFDRGACDHFGALAYGVHVNGIVQRPDGLHMWVGRRAPDRPAWPGKLDNVIGGGIGAGYTARETLVKEAHEEAGFKESIVAAAKAVGLLHYKQDVPHGTRQHTIFLYDLVLPEDMTPRNTDGEVAEFLLLPIDQVIDHVMAGTDFKENCNLVIIDFLIRHGYLTAETIGYEEFVKALHRNRD